MAQTAAATVPPGPGAAIRIAICLVAVLLLLAACGTNEAVWAPDEALEGIAYTHPGATELQLITVMNKRSKRGDHTALVISASSERVIFDPAGSWHSRYAPERHDVHFGITPLLYNFYMNYHARDTHYVVIQRLRVPPEVAEAALAAARQAGPVAPARCARETATLLRSLPGLESIALGWFPEALMAQFGQLPAVERHVIEHDDPQLAQRLADAQATQGIGRAALLAATLSTPPVASMAASPGAQNAP